MPGVVTTLETSNQHSINTWLNSVIGQNLSNEFRVAWSHLGTITGAQDPASEEIPSIEITELGMTAFNAAANRTAIGLAVNLPQFRYNDLYPIQNNLTYVRGTHVMKAGLDVRRQYVKSFFFPTIRGRLVYPTLTPEYSFVNCFVFLTRVPHRGGQLQDARIRGPIREAQIETDRGRTAVRALERRDGLVVIRSGPAAHAPQAVANLRHRPAKAAKDA